MIQLREHQQTAYDNVVTAITNGNGTAKGRVVMPTGAGKTFVEAAVLDYQRANNSKTKIHLVLAPRILLANQLVSEYRNFSGSQAYRVMAFHSGTFEPDDETTAWKEDSTTNPNDIVTAHENAMKNCQDLVVFSTYHSCGKLKDIEFDTMIADESQYCVAENFNDSIKLINARVQLFFTATEKFTASTNGRGLNNDSVYGQRLYYISPAELIKLDLIVAPRLHVMHGQSRSEEDSVISEVIEIAVAQDKLTRKDLGFSKILFAMKGTKDVKAIEDNIAKIKAVMPNHSVFTITSKTGAKIDGVKIRKEDFLAQLKTHENCLIFHYDILSEGIDVDGITGVCLMRNLGLAKLLQTIGRAVRKYKLNPLLKRQAWISVPVINGNEDDKERVKFFISAIRNAGYDISFEDVVETGNENHIADEENVDDAYSDMKNMFGHLFTIEGIFHEVENEAIFDQINVAETLEEKLDILLAA